MKRLLAVAVIAAAALAVVGGHRDHGRSDVQSLADRAERADGAATRAGAAIAGIRDPGAVPALIELVHAQRPVIVRANAIRALAAIGAGADAVRELVADASQPPRVRVEAALALRRLGTASDVAPLGRLLADDSLDDQLRIAIVQALGAIGGARELLERESRTAGPAERAFLAVLLR